MAEANKSGNPYRIEAASKVEEIRRNLVSFFYAANFWKIKGKKYIVPTVDFTIVDAVGLYIKPESVFTKMVRFLGRDKSR